jgi:DNA-binding transcriptional ArsR family regulator
MAEGDVVAAEDGRLSARLAAPLGPRLRDALDHPIRREVLRTLNRGGRSRSVAEIGTELTAFGLGQLGYHLQILRRSGAVASVPADLGAGQSRPRYASEVLDDGQVRAVLRATEQWDRQRREAVAAANSSPLLTMFRVPRPVRTIRLRGRHQGDAERDR